MAVIGPTPRGTGFMEGDDIALLKLDTVINSIVQRFGLQRKAVIIGGFSAGGMGAVKYAEFLKKGQGVFGIVSRAVFAVDAPLVLERWYFGNQVVINRKVNSNDSIFEAKMLNQMLQSVHIHGQSLMKSS